MCFITKWRGKHELDKVFQSKPDKVSQPLFGLPRTLLWSTSSPSLDDLELALLWKVLRQPFYERSQGRPSLGYLTPPLWATSIPSLAYLEVVLLWATSCPSLRNLDITLMWVDYLGSFFGLHRAIFGLPQAFLLSTLRHPFFGLSPNTELVSLYRAIMDISTYGSINHINTI